MLKKFILPFALLIIASACTGALGQDRKSVSAREVNGTFRAKNGSEFKVLALGGGRLRIAFSGVYEFVATAGPTVHVGEAGGEAGISADTAVFRPEETERCTITIKFLTGGRLRVEQEGTDADCGFGVNVSAGGTYKKVSGARPDFGEK